MHIVDSQLQQNIVAIQCNSCAHSYASFHISINDDIAGERVYHVWDILREFLGHTFVSGLCTLKPKNLKSF